MKPSESGEAQQKSTRTKDGWMICVCFCPMFLFSPKKQVCLLSFVVCLYPFRLKIQDQKKNGFCVGGLMVGYVAHLSP